MPEAKTNVRQSADLVIDRTDAWAKSKLTPPGWRLLNCHQSRSLLFGPYIGARPHAVPRHPEPIQAATKSRGPMPLPPSVSPKAMVLEVPSRISAILVFEPG